MDVIAKTTASRICQWGFPALSLAALLATSTDPGAAQSFDPGDESCAGKTEGTACWMELSNQPECYLCNHGLAIGASATWSADCNGGLAEGTGIITWTFGGDKVQFDMETLDAGRHNGRWVILGADDSSGEALYYYTGPYVAGRRYGRWILRYADGTSGEGPYVDGVLHGRWAFRFSGGASCAVDYVRGEQQGECK
ncbi:MAG: hypothetical protein OXK77_12385 [Gemmatimonadota bacterium]|nr:hypothetical protein [Gemmatimonadota bacterium]MDE2864288.1 hypothetical protein [Gemmatimonadota bacterium]